MCHKIVDTRFIVWFQISPQLVYTVATSWQKPKSVILNKFSSSGALYLPPFPDQGQIWHVRDDPQCIVPCQISHVIPRGEKPQIWPILQLPGGSCTHPLTNQGQTWRVRLHSQTHRLHSYTKFHLDWSTVSPLRGENPQIWQSFQHHVVAPASDTETKIIRVHNQKPSPIQWYQKRF